MKKNALLFLFAAWFIHSHIQAQDTPPRYLSTQKKYTFAVQPLQMFSWGRRFDFEVRLGNGPGWLQFGTTAYSITKGDDHFYYEGGHYRNDAFLSLREPFCKLRGGGLDINYKHFIDPYRSLYYAAGLSYALFNIDYNGRLGKWNDYTEDGLLYHEFLNYQEMTHTQHINRMSINQYLGFQPPSRHAFLLDLFVGVSYRHAISDKDKPNFDKDTYSFGYTGFVFMTGVRLGFGIR